MSAIKYRPEIDGLRTVAVLPVILFHLGISWIKGGFYGVDVFFVISGYLITSIILKKLEAGTFSFTDFWLRRVKRILPALITVVLFCFLVFPFLIFPGDLKYMAQDGLAALFSVANFNAYLNLGDYWGGRAESSIFLHAWSLSVEEQFYLVYPLLLFLLYKGKKSLLFWVAIIVLLSFCWYSFAIIFESDQFPLNIFSSNSLAFYMIPSRAWELGAGGIIAVLTKKRFGNRLSIGIKSALSLIGLVMIFLGYFIPTNGDISFLALLPVIGSCLFILFANETRAAGLLLSNSTMVYIGKISYSLYLWHWPFCVLLHRYLSPKLGISTLNANLLILVLTAFFSILSYNLVETKTRFYQHTVKLVGLCTVIILTASSYFMYVHVVNYEKVPFNYVEAYFDYYQMGKKKDMDRSEKGMEKNLEDHTIRYYPVHDTREAYKSGGLVIGNNKMQKPEIMMMGDSHATGWAKVVNEITDSLSTKIAYYTQTGFYPFFKIDDLIDDNFFGIDWQGYPTNVIKTLEDPSIKLLIMTARMENRDQEAFEKFESFCAHANSLDKKVLIINQVPLWSKWSSKNAAVILSYFNIHPNGSKQYFNRIEKNEMVEIANKKLNKIADKYPQVQVFDSYSIFMNGNKVWITDDKDVLYFDDDHLSYQGTLRAKNDLYATIKSMLTANNHFNKNLSKQTSLKTN
ncbi:acyltransferase family protein [Echinicola vietnamensis]|uniref:Putative acyltransferase n=1 Tax=Echinicola vietnamensis (strain DSM 17526 / LMG 23754 / KMM 6221) TaxID=926556 RepID=L0G283_ECHVK|nr:acyltransferase family protein [Echinicola vietnamensis]AGA79637.1 putative acyltransferase [Echinicola vietnamensis DSM 17526]